MALALGTFEFNQRLILPNNALINGGSQSGKTTLIMKLLEQADTKFYPTPTKIVFLYHCFQNAYMELKQKLLPKGITCEFVKSSKITEADLKAIADPNGGETIVVMDDASISAASSPEVANLFTVSRHYHCSIVLLLHFIYAPWPSARIISAISMYLFLMKSARLKPQVATLGGQLGIRKKLVAAYAQESLRPYGYVFVDLAQTTHEVLMLRTDLECDHQRILSPDV